MSESKSGSSPVRLLNKLKLIHSQSNNNNRVNYIQRKLPELTEINKKNKVERLSSNKVERLSRNKAPPAKLDGAKEKLHNNKVNTKADGSRPFSTVARFISTPSNNSGYTLEFLKDIAQSIRQHRIKNIVVMVGAGISCPSGIPDFRTPGSGLYDNLQQYKIPYPEAIFDIDYFYKCPKPFFALAKELFPSGKYRPNKTHYFFKLLEQKKILLRVYTQNIDGLERLAGVSEANLVEAHGTFATATCIRCGQKYSAAHVKEAIDKDDISRCSNCSGTVKPDIVFFGENLPTRFQMYNRDLRQADLLFVMGTSLEVEPFASIVDTTAFSTPRILVNREAVGVFRTKRRVNDHRILGDILDGIDKIVCYLNWEDDLAKVMDQGEQNQIKFVDTIPTGTGNKPYNGNNNNQQRRQFSSMRNSLPPITRHVGSRSTKYNYVSNNVRKGTTSNTISNNNQWSRYRNPVRNCSSSSSSTSSDSSCLDSSNSDDDDDDDDDDSNTTT